MQIYLDTMVGDFKYDLGFILIKIPCKNIFFIEKRF